MLRPFVHMILHLVVPAGFAHAFWRDRRLPAWTIMVATMVVDLDHLFADPIYDPNRCSMGFHPLHAWGVVALYPLLLFYPKTRLVGAGLCIHMALDWIDCLWMGTL